MMFIFVAAVSDRWPGTLNAVWRSGERRPAVVCQHGLEGRPQIERHLKSGATGGEYYKSALEQLNSKLTQ